MFTNFGKVWRDVGAAALLLLTVATLYGVRLSHQPIVGEESRWATGAREMLATGDWVVPRQQGRVFAERPPMTIWAIALVGYVRGEVDAVAVRLPSVVAIVLTSLVLYGYTRAHASAFAAFTAGLCYASMGQVLQIGRMGESEALFTLLVSSSLFAWHLGYSRGWSSLVTWSMGFALAGLGALVKGPQAPVYFVVITAVYLAVRRDWRYLVSWQTVAGAATFIAIVAFWQIPFLQATNWQSVRAIWTGLAADRLLLRGLAAHFFTYPLETFACLLPWSPLLAALAKRETRALFADRRALLQFLMLAPAVAYPTVWIAADARGRYFMPLYPLVAVLVALIIERCSAAAHNCYPRRAWHQFLLLMGSVLVGSCIAVMIPASWALGPYQPGWLCFLLACMVAGCVWVFWTCYKTGTLPARMAAIVSVAVAIGTLYSGAVINVNVARWNDPTSTIERLRDLVGAADQLVSFSPIEHRFAYFYGTPIKELDWPATVDDLPEDIEYFCFMRHPGDTASSRAAGRGRSWTTTTGILPFAWEELATLCVERRIRNTPQPMVVIGRVIRPLQAVVNDATTPQPRSMDLTAHRGEMLTR